MSLRRVLALLILAALLVVAAAAVSVWWFLGSDRVRQTLQAEASRALGEPVQIGRASAALFPRPAVRLLDVQVGEDAAYARLQNVRLSAGLRPLLARRIDDAEVTVSGGRLDLPSLLAIHHGAARTGAAEDRPAPYGVTLGRFRSVVLDQVDLHAGPTVLRSDARARVADGVLEIDRFRAASARSQFDLSGRITTGPAAMATLSVTAARLDLEELAVIVGAVDVLEGPPPAGTPSPAVRLTMDVRVAAGSFGGIAFTDLETRLEGAGRQVLLDPLSASIFDGRFTGTLQVSPGDEGVALGVTGTLADTDAAAVLAHLEQSPQLLTGRLTANLRLEQAAGPRPVLERLRGTVGLSARGGTIQGLSAVSRAIVDLSGRADRGAVSGTDRYEQLKATFGMTAGRLDTRDLTLETEDLEVRGRGRIDLATGALALEADLVLSPELSHVAGRDLYRYAREGDRIMLPARIGGTFDDPAVTLDVADAARRALRNRLEEEASSLLDRLRRGGRQDP